MCKPGFRFRLSVETRSTGLLRLAEKETTLELTEGRTAYVVARDSVALETAKKLHFEAGGYETEKAARAAGEKLRLSLRVLNAIASIGLVVPITDKVSGSLSGEEKAKAEERSSTIIMDDVRGVLVFPDDGRHAEFSIDAEAVAYPSDTTYWFAAVQELMKIDMEFDERAEDAVTFLNMATLETTPRSAFLLTYLALERIVPTLKRDENSLGVLEELKKVVQHAGDRTSKPLGKAESETLLGSLRRLEYESFGNALRRLGVENPDYKVEGISLAKFLGKCTAMRHETAHPSSTRKPRDYESLTRGLRGFTISLLWSKYKLETLSFHRPADSVEIPDGGLSLRLINYERR